jgi:hypothetical protein
LRAQRKCRRHDQRGAGRYPEVRDETGTLLASNQGGCNGPEKSKAPTQLRVAATMIVFGVADFRVGVATMPRTYVVFGDIEGKLDVLRVE